MRYVGFRSKRVFHCEAVSHSEFLPYSEHVLRVVNGAKPWFSKVAENCVGVHVVSGCGFVCISKQQLDHNFVRINQ